MMAMYRFGAWDWDTTESIDALDVWDVCGNCRERWPCECSDPVWNCGICAGDQHQCECDERVKMS